MSKKVKKYRVPANDVRVALQNQLETALTELERQRQESKARQKEIDNHAIPALKLEHARLLQEWQSLPDKVRTRTRQPKLDDNGYIIVYGEATFWRTLRELSYWGRGSKERWYEDSFIKLKDVYAFKHTQRGVDAVLTSRINNLRWDIQQYCGDGYIMMTKRGVEKLKLDPKSYQWELG